MFQPSYDDVGNAQEKDNGRNDTASKEAIEEDWIIVDGHKIGNADCKQPQQDPMIHMSMPQQQQQGHTGPAGQPRQADEVNQPKPTMQQQQLMSMPQQQQQQQLQQGQPGPAGQPVQADEANQSKPTMQQQQHMSMPQQQQQQGQQLQGQPEPAGQPGQEAIENERKKKFAKTYLIGLLANIILAVLPSYIYNSIDFSRFIMVLVPALIIFCLYLKSKFLSALFEKIESLENQMIQFNQLSERIDSLENEMISFNQLSQKIDSMEHEDLIAFEKLSQRIDSLETEIASNEK